MTITRHAADFRLQLADELTRRLPATLAALRHGDIDLRKATILAELAVPLTDEHAARVEAAVLPRAPRQTPPMFRQAVRRAIVRVDPQGAAERHQERRRSRCLELRPADDGMAWLNAYLPYEQAAAIYDHVDHLAQQAATTDDERTADQRRADVLVDLILNPTGDREPRYEVHVTVAASTLLGLDELPAELGGYGPIPADIARDIAADARWRRLLTDPEDGTLLDYGRRTYRPPEGLADHVRARDKTCRFPGCRHPARKCDLDHRIPFPDGPTCDENLIALCRHHHRLKGEGKWAVDQDKKGNVGWRTPTGHRYSVPAEWEYLPN